MGGFHIKLIIYIILSVTSVVDKVAGNGRLLLPPQRSSLWREPAFYRHPDVQRNYDDHTLDCGGYWTMHENNGRCGVCGDPWNAPKPRPNEAGGVYARGIIGRVYSSDKRFIDTIIQVTSSIGGFFEFRICPNNDVTRPVTQECLDKHQMRIYSTDRSTSYGNRYSTRLRAGSSGIVELSVQIPEGLVCSQCVLQWRWHGANNYGVCRNGRWGKGCGKQPEVLNCADIAVLPEDVIGPSTRWYMPGIKPGEQPLSGQRVSIVETATARPWSLYEPTITKADGTEPSSIDTNSASGVSNYSEIQVNDSNNVSNTSNGSSKTITMVNATQEATIEFSISEHGNATINTTSPYVQSTADSLNEHNTTSSANQMVETGSKGLQNDHDQNAALTVPMQVSTNQITKAVRSTPSRAAVTEYQVSSESNLMPDISIANNDSTVQTSNESFVTYNTTSLPMHESIAESTTESPKTKGSATDNFIQEAPLVVIETTPFMLPDDTTTAHTNSVSAVSSGPQESTGTMHVYQNTTRWNPVTAAQVSSKLATTPVELSTVSFINMTLNEETKDAGTRLKFNDTTTQSSQSIVARLTSPMSIFSITGFGQIINTTANVAFNSSTETSHSTNDNASYTVTRNDVQSKNITSNKVTSNNVVTNNAELNDTSNGKSLMDISVNSGTTDAVTLSVSTLRTTLLKSDVENSIASNEVTMKDDSLNDVLSTYVTTNIIKPNGISFNNGTSNITTSHNIALNAVTDTSTVAASKMSPINITFQERVTPESTDSQIKGSIVTSQSEMTQSLDSVTFLVNANNLKADEREVSKVRNEGVKMGSDNTAILKQNDTGEEIYITENVIYSGIETFPSIDQKSNITDTMVASNFIDTVDNSEDKTINNEFGIKHTLDVVSLDGNLQVKRKIQNINRTTVNNVSTEVTDSSFMSVTQTNTKQSKNTHIYRQDLSKSRSVMSYSTENTTPMTDVQNSTRVSKTTPYSYQTSTTSTRRPSTNRAEITGQETTSQMVQTTRGSQVKTTSRQKLREAVLIETNSSTLADKTKQTFPESTFDVKLSLFENSKNLKIDPINSAHQRLVSTDMITTVSTKHEPTSTLSMKGISSNHFNGRTVGKTHGVLVGEPSATTVFDLTSQSTLPSDSRSQNITLTGLSSERTTSFQATRSQNMTLTVPSSERVTSTQHLAAVTEASVYRSTLPTSPPTPLGTMLSTPVTTPQSSLSSTLSSQQQHSTSPPTSTTIATMPSPPPATPSSTSSNALQSLTLSNNTLTSLTQSNNTLQNLTPSNNALQGLTPSINTLQSLTLSNNTLQSLEPSNNTLPTLAPSNNTHQDLTPSNTTHQDLTPSNNTLPRLATSNSTLQSLEPSNNTLPSLAPSNNTHQDLTPSNNTLPRLATSNSTLQSLVPSNNTLQSLTPSNNTLQSFVPSNNTFPSLTPSNNTLQAMTPSNNTLSSLMTSNNTLQSLVQSTNTLQSLAPSNNMSALSNPTTASSSTNRRDPGSRHVADKIRPRFETLFPEHGVFGVDFISRRGRHSNDRLRLGRIRPWFA